MPVWTVFAHTDLAEAAVRQMESSLTGSGVEKTAAKFSQFMLAESERAFEWDVDPRTNKYWQPWADATLKDPRAKALMERSGGLLRALRSGFALVPIGARSFVNVDASQIRKAMIHMYGVTAKRRRSYIRSATGKKEWKNRKNINQTLPARRFVGVSERIVQEMLNYAYNNLMGPTNA